jgi:preprotein translocase subunit SecA
MKEGDAIEHPMLSKSVERAQRKVEERNFQVRKNILEYDEVMEHQRQRFYGLRQRVLEGRDVKGLDLRVHRGLRSTTRATSTSTRTTRPVRGEFARDELDTEVLPERLKGRDADEMDKRDPRGREGRGAVDDRRDARRVHAAEGSDVAVDFDSAGLVEWAKSTFGVEIDVAELREGGSSERRRVQTHLEKAAFERIEATELERISEFTAEDYGARKLSDWAQKKFGVTVPAEEIAEAIEGEMKRPEDLVMDKVRDVYRQREIEYPVDYAIEMTRVIAQQDQAAAFEQLARWARTRFGGTWTPDDIRSVPPQKIRARFLDESEKFVDEDRLPKAIADALECDTDEKLEAHLQERYEAPLPEQMRFLEGKERSNAIRARVETILRNELLFFERTVLLEQFDTAWKDHLYAMDQLRDSINFRAFSQQDPRIAFKREGSTLFKDMLGGIRERVTDVIFRARISPASAFQNAAGAQGRPGAMGARGPAGGRPGSLAGSQAGGQAIGRTGGRGAVPPGRAPAQGGVAAVGTQAATHAGSGGGGASASSKPESKDSEAPTPDAEAAIDANRAALEADKGKPRIR